MLLYIVYILIILIIFFIFILAIKAIKRGIEAKQNLNKDYDHDKYENKKY